MNIETSVFYVGGSKGGVGKSLFSFALVDYLLNQNKNVLLVDTEIRTILMCSRPTRISNCRICSAA